MANNFDLSNLALQAVCPGNEILYDDKGMPSIMVKIPKQTYAQLTGGIVKPFIPPSSLTVTSGPFGFQVSMHHRERQRILCRQDPRASIT